MKGDVSVVSLYGEGSIFNFFVKVKIDYKKKVLEFSYIIDKKYIFIVDNCKLSSNIVKK